MRLVFEDLVGNRPAPYVRKILKECSQKKPPICHKTVTDYLGLTLSDELPEDFPSNPFAKNSALHHALIKCCSRLDRKAKEVWFYKHMDRRRIRLSIFHEDTHFIIPWHIGANLECDDKEIQGLSYDRQEREAFSGGVEFLLPTDMLVDDILSSSQTSFEIIRDFTDRYDASFESTAIKYAIANPRICAVVMVEPSSHLQLLQDGDPLNPRRAQMEFPWNIPLRQRITEDYPLRVRYSARSSRFLKFIRPGTGIDEKNLIFKVSSEKKPQQGEIPASTFGSSEKWSYHAECLPWGKNGKVLVLLWLTDRQRSFKL